MTLIWRGTAGAVMAPVDDEIMPLGLARDGLADRRLEQRIVLVEGPQRGPQVGGILLAQAHIERAGAGQPHAVAALAEIMGQAA